MPIQRTRGKYALALTLLFTTLWVFTDLTLHRSSRISSVYGALRWWSPTYFSDPPPAWLEPPSHGMKPMSIRMAIISHPDEFDKRAAMRRSVLRGVPPSEVDLTYKFFTNIPSQPSQFHLLAAQSPDAAKRVRAEAETHNDIQILDLGEGPLYMGEKRWHMLQWAASKDPGAYDFYLSADTDSFLRIAALARRFRYLRPNVDPRTHAVLWGHMLDANRHWIFTSGNQSMEDPYVDGTPYRYPAGMAFLLSSALVRQITAPGIELARHIKYNLDDVMHGMWTADHAPGTDILDDPAGFHDPPPENKRWQPTRTIDYGAVCVHHIVPSRMDDMRSWQAYARTKEWEAT